LPFLVLISLITGQDLAMEVSNRTAFEIPLATVANSNIAGKTEVSLEFFLPDSEKKDKRRAPDELVEMRFYIPGAHVKGDEEGANGDSTVINADEDQSAAQVFHDAIKEKADIGQATGEGIIVFNEVLVTTPRGRYDIDMFPNFLRLHGKTYDYKVPYNTISRLFLLPKPDDQYVSFVVSLIFGVGSEPFSHCTMTRFNSIPPFDKARHDIRSWSCSSVKMRRCRLRWPWTSRVTPSTAGASPHNAFRATLQEKYAGKLEKTYAAPTFQVVSSVFRGLSGKKILTASQSFAPGGDPGHAVKSNLKAVQGELYFLEKSLFFLSKQPVLIQLSDVHTAVFSR
jgi:structure-specific recognition protein 1